jgi:hypothetical protein
VVLQLRKLCSVPVIAGNILLLALLLVSGSLGAQAPDSINYADDFVLDTFPVKEPPIEEPAEVMVDTYDEDEDDEEAIGSDFMPLYNWGEDQLDGRVRTTRDSLIQQWKSQDEFWYADQSFARNKKPEKSGSPKRSFFASRAFETLLIVLAVVVFVMLLVVYLGQNNAMVFRRSKTVAAQAEEDDFDKDIFSISYDKEIGRAEQDGNYRMAIRLRFLRLLKTMSERQIIRYLQERTNLDYLMQLHGTDWYRTFFPLVRHFEYSWYGKFEVNAGQYARVKADFDEIHKSL